jgi:hypothetical protein
MWLMANPAHALDAAMSFSLHIEPHWRGARMMCVVRRNNVSRRTQFRSSAVVARCIVFTLCLLCGWLLHATSRWLQGAYDVQDWLRARHFGLINDMAEIIAYIGLIPTVAVGALAGVVLAIVFRRPNLALQRMPDSHSNSNPQPSAPAPLS